MHHVIHHVVHLLFQPALRLAHLLQLDLTLRLVVPVLLRPVLLVARLGEPRVITLGPQELHQLVHDSTKGLCMCIRKRTTFYMHVRSETHAMCMRIHMRATVATCITEGLLLHRCIRVGSAIGSVGAELT